MIQKISVNASPIRPLAFKGQEKSNNKSIILSSCAISFASGAVASVVMSGIQNGVSAITKGKVAKISLKSLGIGALHWGVFAMGFNLAVLLVNKMFPNKK